MQVNANSSTTSPAASGGLRQRLEAFINNGRVQGIILALIAINAVILGLETSPAVMAEYGTLLVGVDRVILAVFVVEILIRLYVYRLAFFRDPWSIFDFIVVGIALVPATGQLSVLRALRVLRVLRVMTIVPSMRKVVGALLGAIPGLSSIALVLLLIYYVFAVIATNLFAASFPDWFGDLGRSFYTLFQVMTLESWSMGISRPVMEVYPYAWLFFIPFILIATFSMLNLFIAVIVNAMQTVSDAEHEETRDVVGQTGEHLERELHVEVQALREEIRALHKLIQSGKGRDQA
ncbi:MAG TPA: ion transporter [Noviherbaspirillum sp.]|nr:ion transporter [Noviherbaspirillum sp.]